MLLAGCGPPHRVSAGAQIARIAQIRGPARWLGSIGPRAACRRRAAGARYDRRHPAGPIPRPKEFTVMTGAHSDAATGGLVEVFDEREIAGWVEDAPATGPVRISLQVNGIEVASTWAVDPAPRRGAGVVRSLRLGLHDLWN